MNTAQETSIVLGFLTSLALFSCLCYCVTGIAGVALLWFWIKDSIIGPRGAQDVFEIQVFHRGYEAEESVTEWEECTKNPNHIGFIPAPEFRIEHLPTEYQTDDWFFYLQNFTHMAVRLRVNAVSPNRPRKGPYSLNLKDSLQSHSGTGYIGGFKAFNAPCPCRECKSTGKEKFWRLMITTAAHVVFDEHEAKATYVDMFFDDEDARRDGRMKSVRGYELKGASSHIDVCIFHCAIHDEAVAEMVRQKRSNVVQGWRRIRDKLMVDKVFKTPTKAFLASHPHGQPKMITIGDIEKLQHVAHGEGESEYAWEIIECSYSTGSCPGSSGGQILWLGDYRIGDMGYGWWFGSHSRGDKDRAANHGARLCIKRKSAMFFAKNK